MFEFILTLGIFSTLIGVAYNKCKTVSRQNHLKKAAHDFVENAIVSNTLYPFESSYKPSGYEKGSCERFQDMHSLSRSEARTLVFTETKKRGIPYFEEELPPGGLAQFVETPTA